MGKSENKRLRVKLSPSPQASSFLLQTPKNAGIWGDVEFFVDDNRSEADAWVIYEGLSGKITTVCPPSRTLFVTGEPADIKKYSPFFLNQFAHVLTSQEIDHRGSIRSQQALPWRYGFSGRFCHLSPEDGFVENYDSLSAASPFEKKERLISTVCSTKAMCDGHVKRTEFVSFLERARISGLDIFGRGREREVLCKRDAIAPYKYHIALENSSHHDYWTEKLADAYLGGAHPFYWGCPNIGEYFPTGSFTLIDIDRPEEALRIIRNAVENKTYEKSRELLNESRDLVLNKYNLFPVIVSLLKEHPGFAPSDPVLITLHPEDCFSLRGNLRRFGTFLRRIKFI